MAHRTWIELNEQALIRNINALRDLTSEGARFCPVVKSNAYGHGLKEVAKIMGQNGVDAFAVENIDEALTLRTLFPNALIITIGYVPAERFPEAVTERIDITVSNKQEIQELDRLAAKTATKASIHLKIDTGMSRLGIMPNQAKDYIQELTLAKHIHLSGISTHYADIKNPADPSYTTMQFQQFQQTLQEFTDAGLQPDYIHSANSSGLILYPELHGNLVRPGIACYGLWPSPEIEVATRKYNIQCDLTPVLTWKTTIGHIKTIPPGTPIGYGLTEVVQRTTRIAVLPVGYADGYPRAYSKKAEVLVSGIRCKILGSVCMNLSVIDISPVPNTEIGQEVVLLGRAGRNEIPARELAKLSNTSEYEVVTRINPLLPRIIN